MAQPDPRENYYESIVFDAGYGEVRQLLSTVRRRKKWESIWVLFNY